MKRLIPIGLIILIIAAWGSVLNTGMEDPKQERQHLQMAAAYEERELYFNAIQEYMAAREYMEDDYEIRMKVIDLYEKLGNIDTCIDLCRQVINSDPYRQEPYEKLVKYYTEQENTRRLIPFIYTAKENFPDNQVFQDTFKKLEKEYRVMGKGFEELSEFTNGRAIVKMYSGDVEGGKPVIEETVIETSGFKAIDQMYPTVRFTDDPSQLVVKDSDGKWKIINSSGYAVANNPDKQFEEIGNISEGYGQAVLGGVYHLVNSTLAVSNASWDYIGTFHNGYTASQKGGKWAVFSADGLKEATEYQFDDIKENNYGYAYENGCLAAKKDGKYWFINEAGEVLSEQGFDDVKAFESNQPTAAMSGSKWGFVVSGGQWYLEPQYEDAKPFCNGYAPVKVDGLWGYINQYNEIVVEPQFQEAGNVTKEGIAPVKGEYGWDILRLDILYYRQ